MTLIRSTYFSTSILGSSSFGENVFFSQHPNIVQSAEKCDTYRDTIWLTFSTSHFIFFLINLSFIELQCLSFTQLFVITPLRATSFILHFI